MKPADFHNIVAINPPNLHTTLVTHLTRSLLSRHRHCRLRMRNITLPPVRDDRFNIREEIQALLPAEVVGAQKTAATSGERKHGEWHRDRHVYTYLSDVNFRDEFPCRRAVSCKDGRAVTVGIVVDGLNSFVEGVNEEANQYGTEDFFLVAFHGRGDAGKYGRADEVALLESWYFDGSPVQDEFCALLHA